MSIKINIELNLDSLKQDNLTQVLYNRLRELSKQSYNRLSSDILKQSNSQLRNNSINQYGQSTIGGEYRPKRFSKDASPYSVTRGPWGKFWFKSIKDIENKVARVYIGSGNGKNIIELNYDFLFQREQIPDVDEETIQNAINDAVPGWVGGADQLLRYDDFPENTYLGNLQTFIAGNSLRGYIYATSGNRWLYSGGFTSGLSLLNYGPFWLAQHVTYNPIVHNLKLEHIVLPYKRDTAIVVIHGSNVIQDRKVDLLRTAFAGGTKSGQKSFIFPSPFRYSITQNEPKHEFIMGRAPENFQISGLFARLAPYPNGSLSQFDENQTIRFQIMAGPDIPSYYRNGAIPSSAPGEPQATSPEWAEGYAITPILTVTTVPVNVNGDPPDNHGYDLDDVFNYSTVNPGTTGPRVYRSRPVSYGYGIPGETFVTPTKGDYLWCRIHSVRDKNGNDIYPIQDTTGYNYDRDYHQALFIYLDTNNNGTAGPSNSSTSSFLTDTYLIDSRYVETFNNEDTEEHKCTRCFLVSQDNIKEIDTPPGINNMLIPRVIGTLTVQNAEDQEDESITIAQSSSSVLNWASGADALDTEDYGPRVDGLDTPPTNLLFESETFANSNGSFWKAGYNQGVADNVQVVNETVAPPIEGYKAADQIIMKKRTVNTYFETGKILFVDKYKMDAAKKYVFSGYFKWADFSDLEPSYPGEEVDNSDEAKLARQFLTLEHWDDSGLLLTNTVGPLPAKWYRHSLTFQPTGKNDRIRISNWNSKEHASLNINAWGLQLEEFKSEIGEDGNTKEGPTEYQKRGLFQQLYFQGVFNDAIGKKNNGYPTVVVQKIPYYQFVKQDIGGYYFEDHPIDLGISGQDYNWIDALTWRTFEPQDGEYINPIDSPFGKWSPVIYDVIMGYQFKGDGQSSVSRGDYGAPTFNIGPRSTGPDGAGNYITSHLSYNPSDYPSNTVVSYDHAIKIVTEGIDGKKRQDFTKLNTTNNEAIYGPFKIKRTQSSDWESVNDFEEASMKITTNRYNWSLDQKQMRMIQFTDFNNQSSNHEKLLLLGFTESQLKF